MKKKKYHVWECKVIVDGDRKLPPGFDYQPRSAVQDVIENNGYNVISCFSGWGGKLTKNERVIVNHDAALAQSVEHSPCKRDVGSSTLPKRLQ